MSIRREISPIYLSRIAALLVSSVAFSGMGCGNIAVQSTACQPDVQIVCQCPDGSSGVQECTPLRKLSVCFCQVEPDTTLPADSSGDTLEDSQIDTVASDSADTEREPDTGVSSDTATSSDTTTTSDITQCVLGQPCDDDDLCTQFDECTRGGFCVGQPVGCDDGNECTTDFCDPIDGCDSLVFPKGVTCDDGLACTSADKCSPQGVCVGQPVICDDGDSCTVDSCDADGKCVFSVPQNKASLNFDGKSCFQIKSVFSKGPGTFAFHFGLNVGTDVPPAPGWRLIDMISATLSEDEGLRVSIVGDATANFPEGAIYVGFGSTTQWVANGLFTKTSIFDGKWHYLSVAINAGVLSASWDGVAIEGQNFPFTFQFSGDAMIVGCKVEGADGDSVGWSHGQIDDLHITTDGQLFVLPMALPLQATQNTLGLYTFDGANPLLDVSGNGQHGVWYGDVESSPETSIKVPSYCELAP